MNQLTEVKMDEIINKQKHVAAPLREIDETIILHYHKPENIHGQIIGKIASSFYYVYDSIKINDLVDALIEHEELLVVGVVNAERDIIGVIPRRELFDAMSKLFGRDLYKHKDLGTFILRTEIFNFKKNIFSVANMLAEYLDQQKTRYYLLENDSGTFAGIFSSKDLLVYLSQMTQKDIQLAKRLQSCVVKEETVQQTTCCDIIGASRMAKGVGGDFYSIHEYEKGRWILSICDVSGKGISAALLSVIIGGMFNIYDFRNGIKDYLINLNRYLYNSFEAEKFVTGIFIDYNENTGEVQLFDAGHSYSFLYRKDKLYKVKSKKEVIPLGIDLDFSPEATLFQLKKDDFFIIMTDGIEDQQNAEGEQYGLKRVLSILGRYGNENIKHIKDRLFEDLTQFRKNQTQNDDMTLIFLKNKI